MRYIEYGPYRKKLSAVMLGLMRVLDMDQASLSAFLHSALDLGINCIDTADIYADGKSETLLGDVFAAEPALRDQFFLQTKVGIHRDGDVVYYDFSKDYIVEAVHASLERLRQPHVDALLLHRPDILMEPEEVADALSGLRQDGSVLSVGVSNQNPITMRRLQRACAFPLAVNQIQLSPAFAPAFEAVLNANMETGASCMRDGGIFEYAAEHNQVIQTWSSLQYGFFEGTFLKNPKFQELNDTLDAIAKAHKVSAAAIAIAWNLRYPAKMQAIVGTTDPKHLADLAAGADIDLTRKEWYAIYRAAGHPLP